MYMVMRVSEVFALRWEHIDFKAGAMLVQQAVVNGLGKVNTIIQRQILMPKDVGIRIAGLGWKQADPSCLSLSASGAMMRPLGAVRYLVRMIQFEGHAAIRH
jgi:hypothetical protein